MVAPFHEGAFRELLNVALVDEVDRFAIVLKRVDNRGTNESLRTELRNGLDTNATHLSDVPTKLVQEILAKLLGVGRSRFNFESRVHVFGVLSKNHHVNEFRVLYRRRYALEPSHGSQAHVQVEELTKCDIKGTKAATYGCRERSFNANQMLAKRFNGFVGQPVTGLVECLFASEYFFPLNSLAVLRGGPVEDQFGRGPNVDAGAVTFDERNDWIVRNVQDAVSTHRDFGGHNAILRLVFLVKNGCNGRRRLMV